MTKHIQSKFETSAISTLLGMFLDLVFCPKTKLSEGQLNWQNQPEWGEALCLAFSPDKAAWLLSRSSCHWILCHSSPTTGCSSFQFVPLPRWWWCCFGVIKAVNDFNLWSHSGMGLSWSTGSLTRSVSHRPKFSRRIFQRRFPVLGILAAFHLVLWQWWRHDVWFEGRQSCQLEERQKWPKFGEMKNNGN